MSETAKHEPDASGVKHMKWWGWGVDGVAFHHEDKPAFAPFVMKAVGLDLWATEPLSQPAFDEKAYAASRAPKALITALGKVVGTDDVHTDAMARLVHTYGKSIRDLIRIRNGLVERTVDVVVYPDDEDELQRIVDIVVKANGVLIPFGGGSNIASSLEPHADEERPVVSVDMGRLNRVLEIDDASGIARVQAGVLGPDLEEQLNAKGWTIGHYPDSFTHSTLGGWVATRSSGMQSDKYGDIADIARGLRMVRPGGVLALRPLPSTSSGPSVREMILGSEGRLGIISEVWVQVHRTPEQRVVHAYFFKTFQDGLDAMEAIAASDAAPSITRVSDGNETGFSLATSKESKGVSKFVQDSLFSFLEGRGWKPGEIALSFIGFEGSPSHVKQTKAVVDRIIKKHHGLGVGTGPGVLYDQKKFDTPYLRDFLLDRGTAGDVSETAAPWSKLAAVHANAYAAAHAAYEKLGRHGWIMSHLSHSYHSGACLYFTFAWVYGDDPIAEYEIVKSAIQQSFVDSDATISHHHGVGLEHAPWLEQDISPEGVAVMSGLFASADPGGNLNPRKVVV